MLISQGSFLRDIRAKVQSPETIVRSLGKHSRSCSAPKVPLRTPDSCLRTFSYTRNLYPMSISSVDRVERTLSMSSKLVGWSFFYSVACLVGTILSLWAHSRGPLVIAGMVSFGSLFYLYGAAGFQHRILYGANLLTFCRLLLTLSLFSLPFLPNSGLFILLISLVILIADGFDGWLARRRNEVTEFGEYFDKETDAFFLLTLCVLAYWQNKLGAWILIPGLLRYIFVIFMAVAQPDENKEYRSKWARIIFVVMIGSLLSVFVLPAWLYAPAVTLATTALVLSFAHYFKWILVQKHTPRLHSSSNTWLVAFGGFVFINSLLLLPSFITHLSTSTFFPIPGLKDPSVTAYWTRGWYDHFLHYVIRRPNQDIFRICVDLVALITILFAATNPKKTQRPWVIKRFVSPAIIALFLYEVYDALVYSFFHRPGILIEDAQYSLNLYYILRDALSPEQAPIFIAAATGFVLLLWTLPGILNAINNTLHSIRPRTLLPAGSLVFWSIALFFWYWFGTANPDPTIRSITGKVAVNISDSFELKRTIEANKTLPIDPVYSTFSSTKLPERPDIYLFLVESYGSVVNEDPDLREIHQARIDQMEIALHEAGWLSATTESAAPVSGGLSWLSMSSTLSGMFIDNKAQYTSFLDHIDSYPHLVQFLDDQGYTTITLQPPNRPRPGLPLENPFKFDHTVYFQELGYTGDPYGVWIIPDQYSLEFTYDNYIEQDDNPSFLFFETASTHAPWVTPPPLVEDWQALNKKRLNVNNKTASTSRSFIGKISDSYNNRFNKEIPNTLQTYYSTISYDFDVLTRFILEKADSQSLIVILGDHQPPLLKSSNFNTPLHVITKDATLHERLEGFAFTPGLSIADQSSSELTHAGIYSLLIDLLSTPADSKHSPPSSSYRPKGIPPSIIP